ncbi:RNA polymerase sigma factor FliA [Jeongeupia chitinilytica]|nr:RNA polymerase sigma factor FliA [Jeongeupia chitinilytica]
MRSGYAECQQVRTSPEASAEQQWLFAYLPLVKRVVRQLGSQAGAVLDRQDMEQIGLLGLLDALRRYGGTPDEKFGGYAAMRIRGAILDELRRQDWRPRTVRQATHKLRDAVRELTRRIGREPTEQEVIKVLGISAEDYQDYLLADNAESLASFDELFHDADVPGEHSASPESILMSRLSLEQALTALDEREQRVIQLYYEFDLSLKEIAAVLELTEARVCQINKGALKKMRAFLQDA